MLTVIFEPSLPELIVSVPVIESVKEIVLYPAPALIDTFLPKFKAVIVSESLVPVSAPFLKSEFVKNNMFSLFKENIVSSFNDIKASPDAPVTFEAAKPARFIAALSDNWTVKFPPEVFILCLKSSLSLKPYAFKSINRVSF